MYPGVGQLRLSVQWTRFDTYDFCVLVKSLRCCLQSICRIDPCSFAQSAVNYLVYHLILKKYMYSVNKGAGLFYIRNSNMTILMISTEIYSVHSSEPYYIRNELPSSNRRSLPQAISLLTRTSECSIVSFLKRQFSFRGSEKWKHRLHPCRLIFCHMQCSTWRIDPYRDQTFQPKPN